jgi:branched-chain amino acid aminotransferase
MSTWVSIDGVVAPGAEARISVFDRGFLYGDSVYEVLRTVERRPLFWADHVARLWTSAALLEFHLDFGPDDLLAEVRAALGRVEDGESSIRVVVTRGTGPLSPDPALAASPTRVVIVQPLKLPDAGLVSGGCALTTFAIGGRGEGGVDPRVKSGSNVQGVLAAARAHAAGAYEALRIDAHGRVFEGASSTFFLVCDGALLTPPLGAGILEGITRRKVLRLATEAGIHCREAEVHLADFAHAQEAFITSSTRGIVPVRRVDDHAFGPPGPVTQRLLAAYAGLIRHSVV